jgi:hypothetical protein
VVSASPDPAPRAVEEGRRCSNCETPLAGPYCHVCGQPERGIVRHFLYVLRDFLDTVFEYDSRLWTTMAPLYLRPGRITCDYLAGKRVRFVMPFRLFFVLTVVAFLLVQLTVRPGGIETPDIAPTMDSIERADDVTTVAARRDRALGVLAERREALDPEQDAVVLRAIDASESLIRNVAERRIDWLEAVQTARDTGIAPPPYQASGLQLGVGTMFEVQDVQIQGLPPALNATLQRWAERAQRNLQRASDEPEHLIRAFVGHLPAVLFVLMPLFALLLKVLYLPQRRLYMEHLVVALHSHSFLSLSLIIVVVLSWLGEAVPALETPLAWLRPAVLLWVPIYLFVMQWRVYGQSLPMTLFKYALIGLIYTAIVVLGVIAAVVFTLVTA